MEIGILGCAATRHGGADPGTAPGLESLFFPQQPTSTTVTPLVGTTDGEGAAEHSEHGQADA